MNKFFLFICVLFNIYYLFMSLIILTQQYYSLFRLYKLKFNKKYMSKIANIDDFDMIITDDKLESDIHAKNIIKAH